MRSKRKPLGFNVNLEQTPEAVTSYENLYEVEGKISFEGATYGELMFKFLDLCQGKCVSRTAAAEVLGVSNRLTRNPRRKTKAYANFLGKMFKLGSFREAMDDEGVTYKIFTISVKNFLELVVNGNIPQ